MRAHTDFLTTLGKVHHDHAEKQPLLGSRSSFIVSFLFAILAVLIERNEPSNEPLLARSPGCSGKILRRARRVSSASPSSASSLSYSPSSSSSSSSLSVSSGVAALCQLERDLEAAGYEGGLDGFMAVGQRRGDEWGMAAPGLVRAKEAQETQRQLHHEHQHQHHRQANRVAGGQGTSGIRGSSGSSRSSSSSSSSQLRGARTHHGAYVLLGEGELRAAGCVIAGLSSLCTRELLDNENERK